MIKFLAHTVVSIGLTGCLFASTAIAQQPLIGLIVKTETNPFFLKIKQAALKKSDELGVELRTFAGSYDGDTKAQIEAIQTLILAGASGILITPSDPAAVAETISKARQAGIFVVALDTPFDQKESVDATFATDNFKAGELIGMWAQARLANAATDAKLVTLDGSGTHVTVEVLRNQGFLKGFGI